MRAAVIVAGSYSSSSRAGGGPLLPALQDFNNRPVDTLPGNPGGLRDYDERLEQAEREIDRYC